MIYGVDYNAIIIAICTTTKSESCQAATKEANPTSGYGRFKCICPCTGLLGDKINVVVSRQVWDQW